MKNAIVIVLALAACSKGKDKDAAEDKAAPAAAAKATEAKKTAEPPRPQPLPIKAFVELDTKQLGFKPQVVLGKTPEAVAKELPQYLRKDKTSEAVSKRTEAMMADMKKQVESYGVDTTKKTDVEIRLPPTPASTRSDGETHVILHQDDDKTIRQYGVWFETTPAEREEIVKTFDEVWGAHKVVNETLGPRLTWFAAKEGVRASTKEEKKDDRIDVDYVRYLPLAKFFGEPGALWGFEKAERPLIGATIEEVQAAYGPLEVDKVSETIKLELPPTDYDGGSSVTMILMFTERGKVRQWHASLPFKDYEPARAEYEAALDAKFGKPKPARHEHLIYAKKVDVQYSKYTHELDIDVNR